MQIIPTQPVPAQLITVTLDGQACQIVLSQKSTGIFCDLYLIGELIIGGVICQNGNAIVRNAYLGFAGDLAIVDMQGSDDPQFDGLGTRWALVYYSASELRGAA